MAKKDVNIKLKLQGGKETEDGLKKTGAAAEKAGQKAKEGADQAAKGTEKLNESNKKTQKGFGKFTSTLTAYAGKLFAIGAVIAGVTKAINVQSEAIKEHASIAEQRSNDLMKLQYLGGYFKERPELRKDVGSLAEYGRREFSEVAGAWYNLRSKAGGLGEKQQMGILREAIELGRTDPATPLDQLVDMMTLYAKQTGEGDANKIQNVVAQTIREAGSSTEGVSRYMPQFLPVGKAGGLSGAEAAGVWAYATTQMADPSIATTGLRATFMGLQGKGNPEARRMMRRMGIREEDDFFSKIGALSGRYQEGRLNLGQAEQIAGREGSAVLLRLLENPEAMLQTVANVKAKDTGDVDVTRGMINELLGSDEYAQLADLSKLLNIKIENFKDRDIDALRAEVAKKIMEYNERREGIPEAGIQLNRKVRGMGLGAIDMFGGDIGNAGFVGNTLNNPNLYKSLYTPLPKADPNAGGTHIHYHNDTINNYNQGDVETERYTDEEL